MTRTPDREQDGSASRVERGILRGARLSLLAVTVTVQFGLTLPALVAHADRYRPLWLEVTGFALMASVAAGTAVFLARRRTPPAARWVGVTTSLVAAAAAAAAAPPGNHLDPAHWYFGLVGWYGVLLLFDLPLGHLAAFLGANLALAAAKAGLSQPPEPRTWAAMAVPAVSVYVFQLAMGLLVQAVRRVAVRADEAAAEEERMRTEEAVAEHMHRDHQRRYVDLLSTTVPLLAGLGYGSLDPTDPDTRRRCAHEAARMRRLFAENDDVADRLVHELRAVIDVGERNGVTVQFAVRGGPRELPKEARRELIDPVAAVLAASSSTARVTVVRSPERVRVSAVGDVSGVPPPEFAARHVEIECVVTGDRLWVEAIWRQGKPSR